MFYTVDTIEVRATLLGTTLMELIIVVFMREINTRIKFSFVERESTLIP